MDRRQILLKLVLDELGIPCEVDVFDKRLALQKAVYLARAAGVDLGYHFTWYLRGPYAPSLAEDAYGIDSEIREGDDETKDWTLGNRTRRHLSSLKQMVGKIRKDQPRMLELLASVHYLIDHQQIDGQDAEALKNRLEKFNKNFTTNEVDWALGELRGNGFIN